MPGRAVFILHKLTQIILFVMSDWIYELLYDYNVMKRWFPSQIKIKSSYIGPFYLIVARNKNELV